MLYGFCLLSGSYRTAFADPSAPPPRADCRVRPQGHVAGVPRCVARPLGWRARLRLACASQSRGARQPGYRRQPLEDPREGSTTLPDQHPFAGVQSPRFPAATFWASREGLANVALL